VFSGLIVGTHAYSQASKPVSSDSVPVRFLNELLVNGVKLEDNKGLAFYKPNQANTTEDVLCHMAQVSLVRRGAYGQEPVIRGLSAGQINVSIDGMRMFGACTDKMDPVSIYVEPQNLKQIDVQASTIGSSTGATVGGSVNFQLADASFVNPLYLEVGTSVFSASKGVATFFTFNKAFNKNAWRLNGVYRKHQPYRQGGGGSVPYTQYEKFNMSGSYMHGLNAKDTLQADVLVDYGWNIGFSALPMDVGYARTILGSVQFSRNTPDEFVTKWVSKIYFNTIYHEMDDTHREQVSMHMDMPGSSNTGGAFADGNLKPLGNHRASFRLDTYVNYSLAEMTMYPEDEQSMYMQTWPGTIRSVSGLFLKDVVKVSSSAEVSASMRIDYALTKVKDGLGADQLEIFYPGFERRRQQVLPVFNLVWSQYIGRDFLLNLQAGYGQRIPTVSEHTGFYLFNRMDGYDYIGNPDLKNEKSVSENMSLTYYGNKLELTTTLFNQNFTDYIMGKTDFSLSPMTPGANGVRVYKNVGQVWLSGVEVSLRFNPLSSWQFMQQTRYTYGVLNHAEALPLIPPLTAQTSIIYSFKKLSAQADVEHAWVQNHFNALFGEDATPAYLVANLRLNYELNGAKADFRFQAGIENIFDARYHAHLDWGNTPRSGRNFFVTLVCRLN
jgi:iron complex outermembrane receptor protein